MTTATMTTAVTVVCPSWCTVTTAEHLADLDNLEGSVIHSGELTHNWALSAVTLPDGTPDPEPGDAPVTLMHGDTVINPSDARAYAQHILGLVEEATR